MDSLLRALGDPARFRILHLLLAEEMTQKELQEALVLDKRTMSTHVEALVRSGLVDRRSPRGKCFVVRLGATLKVLQAIADLGAMVAEDRARETSQLADRLRSIDTRAKPSDD